jgi:two-component system, chemotaxis family, sensor kinase CheA
MVDLSKFKDLFVSEAEEHIAALNKNLLLLEKNPTDLELLNELMRSAHTIKGSSATMGFKEVAFLTHIIEDIFDYARDKLLEISPEIIDAVFAAVDALEQSLKEIKKNGAENNLSEVSQKLKTLTGVTTEGISKSLRDANGKPIAKIQKEKNPVESPKSEPKQEEVMKKTDQLSHIKVPVERLDRLLDLAEELVIEKMRLETVLKKSLDESKELSDSEIQKRFPIIPRLKPVVNNLNRMISDIQLQVMQSRLVPVDQVFFRFNRMVRDLSKQQDKEVKFEVTGGEMELDRSVVDKLGDPLVHLLRNAIDHGIEKEGVLRLQAIRAKDFATISVENTGLNIDPEEVRKAAVEKKIISEVESHSFDKNKIFQLLFHPQLSTSKEITETSGRGVGLSVVKQFADQVNGRVIVESPLKSGNGARFTLELPLTLAIIQVLLTRVKQDIFAIPFSSLERSVSVSAGNIKSIGNQKTVIIDGVDIPLLDLRSFLKKSEEKEAEKEIKVVLVKKDKKTIGLVVDELLNEQEIIVKPLPDVIQNTKGFSGSSVLGDGQTILILDVASLIEQASK